MNPIAPLLASSIVLLGVAALVSAAGQGQAQQELALTQNVGEEMRSITKSLEDLLGELAIIKQEATGRLSNVKNRASTSDQERIRQTKVSRFVLKRVAELESESLGMREELSKIFALQKSVAKPLLRGQQKQEEQDFDSSEHVAATTLQPQEEAAKIGFDVEALKKLGEEIGKRLDQFGKDAAKNLGDLIEGVKLVFREPAAKTPSSGANRNKVESTAAPAPANQTGAELESELEARQQQTPESFRGVHEQVIKLVDNMVQNYLSNVRRTVQRMTTLVGGRRPAESESRPRQSPGSQIESASQGFQSLSNSIYGQIDAVARTMNEFTNKWNGLEGRQQSPLVDRIPPRGVELWRDFWDTVRKQVRRINQEFYQLSRDMSRMITGQMPISRGPTPTDRPSLHYSAPASEPVASKMGQRFQEFYDKMSATLGEEQLKMDNLDKTAAESGETSANSLIEEQDDQFTKDELTRNPALRMQIQQEISVFGSIFDIMRAFVQRLRESATNMVRDVVRPGASNNNNNDPVTPGPSVKPQVDQLLGETINSQRLINSQSKPVLLPNARPAINPQH